MRRRLSIADRAKSTTRRCGAGLLVVAAGFLACTDPNEVEPDGNLVLALSVAEGSDFSQVDVVRVTLERPGFSTSFNLRSSGPNQFSGTQQGLEPGDYTVTLQAIESGNVPLQAEFMGQTTATVTAGGDAPVSLTLAPFWPVIDPVLNTTALTFTVTWPHVALADGYDLEISDDPNFAAGTIFAPDQIALSGSTVTATVTVPNLGVYYMSARSLSTRFLESIARGVQTASVITAEVLAGATVSNAIAAPDELQVFGITAAAGEGMMALAFRTDASNLDLDVAISPINGGSVGGNNDGGIFGDDSIEWLVAYESPGSAPADQSATRMASRTPHRPSIQLKTQLNQEKQPPKFSATAAVGQLRTRLAKDRPAPMSANSATAFPASDQRSISVRGASSTTGAFDVVYESCQATETTIGQGNPGTLGSGDCAMLNFFTVNLTYTEYWVFDANAGDTIQLDLSSSAFDPVLYLFGPAGSLVRLNDDFGSGTDSRIIVVLQDAGQYIALPGTYEDLGTGDYDLNIAQFVSGTTVDYIDVTPFGSEISGVGNTAQLTAEAFDPVDVPVAGAAFTWFSANAAVATVDANGLVTAQGAGQVVIVAEADGVQGYAVVTVTDVGLLPVLQWTTEATGVVDALFGLWGTDTDNVVAVGLNGRILNRNAAGSWVSASSPVNNLLYSVWGLTASRLYAVGADGTLLTNYDGATWNIENSGTSDTLLGIWGSAPDDIWAVGLNGTIVHTDGDGWYQDTSPIGTDLFGVWGSSRHDIFAVGPGEILHYDGNAWTQMTVPVSRVWRGVWGTGPNDVFVVGGQGSIVHYDGTTWSQMSVPVGTFLRSVWGAASDDVFVVGNNGVILNWDGTGTDWKLLASGTTATLRAVWGSPARPDATPFAAGNNGVVLSGTRRAQGNADATTSTVTAAANAITKDGVAATPITVQLKDNGGANLIVGGDLVTVQTNSGTLSAVTDNGDGTYTATLTSGSFEETARVNASVDGLVMADQAYVDFVPSGEVVGDGSFTHGTSWTSSATAFPTLSLGDPWTSPGVAVLGQDTQGVGVNSTSDQLSQNVTIPATGSTTLSFWYKITTDETTTTTAFDALDVLIDHSGGTAIVCLISGCAETLSNLHAGTSYTQVTADVTAFAGQTVTLRLSYTSDGSLPTLFRLDNISAAPPGASPAAGPSGAGDRWVLSPYVPAAPSTSEKKNE